VVREGAEPLPIELVEDLANPEMFQVRPMQEPWAQPAGAAYWAVARPVPARPERQTRAAAVPATMLEMLRAMRRGPAAVPANMSNSSSTVRRQLIPIPSARAAQQELETLLAQLAARASSS